MTRVVSQRHRQKKLTWIQGFKWRCHTGRRQDNRVSKIPRALVHP